jgi:hypothetical protein
LSSDDIQDNGWQPPAFRLDGLYGGNPVRELMLKEALEADGLELPEEKPEERERRQRL